MKDIKRYKNIQTSAFQGAQVRETKLEPLMPYEEQFKGGYHAESEDELNRQLAAMGL